MMTIRIGRQRLRLDPIAAAKVFQDIEIASRIKGRRPISDMLRAIGAWLSEHGIDRPTPTQCWSVWVLVWEYVDRLANREQVSADLAFWYGVDPYRLSNAQRVGLWGNLGRVQAQQQLNQGRFDPSDYNAVYRLVALATGSEELAQQAKADALERYVQAEMAKGGAK